MVHNRKIKKKGELLVKNRQNFKLRKQPPLDDVPISDGINAPSGGQIKFAPRLDLNVTTNGIKPKIVVYNRVPKCGSQTLSMLINQLARKNGFLSKAVFQAGEKPERSTTGNDCLSNFSSCFPIRLSYLYSHFFHTH